MENEVRNSFRTGYTKGLGFGLLLMLIGILFLGFNFGFIPMPLKSVVFSWPMLLVFIGFVNLFKRKWISGILLIVVGKFFLVPRILEAYPTLFPALNGHFVHIYWPMLFIAVGLFIVLQRIFYPIWGFETWANDWQTRGHRMRHQHRRHSYSKWEGTTEGFSKNSVFGSGDHIVLDPEFKGGELNAVFGGLSLDLRRTNLPVGETRLDVNAVFGGITIFVPADWFVETHLDAIFGGFQDNRMPKEPLDATKKLIITGSCVFGGGEIRN